LRFLLEFYAGLTAKKMAKNWKREIARDFVALGSIPFYFIVIIRAIIGQFPPFIYQLVIALFVILILSKIIKNSNEYVARGLVLVVFTSLFYKATLYTIFAFLLWFMMIVSSSYLKVKPNEIVKGILFGALSVIISYGLASLFV